MISELSILIPVYNDNALPLVSELQRQAAVISGLEYEILAVDDGSTDACIILENEAIDIIEHCKYVRCPHSDCRAAMRNNMARYRKYEWCLMVDARLTIPNDDFLLRYLTAPIDKGEVVCGGVCVDGGVDTKRLYHENLRFRYEKHEERNHSLQARQAFPYRSFRTTNFFYHRTVLERVPYDERIKGYGYEDVMLGKALEQAGIAVNHIDNPVAYTYFEDNQAYLCKLNEALQTLHDFETELRDYSPLLYVVDWLRKYRLEKTMLLLHKLCLRKIELCNLRSRRPSLLLLKLYKLGTYLS